MTQEPEGPVVSYRSVMAVGGRRHGEMIEVQEGVPSWVDLMTAETYYAHRFHFVEQNPVNPRSAALRKGFTAEALVHESIARDVQAANGWWQALALSRLFREIGGEVPVTDIIARTQRPPGAAAPERN